VKKLLISELDTFLPPFFLWMGTISFYPTTIRILNDGCGVKPPQFKHRKKMCLAIY